MQRLLKNLCRLCLNENGKVCIFTDGDDGNDYVSKKINECLGIKIYRDSILPTTVCEACLSSVNSWYRFKQKCQESQIRLMSIIEKDNNDSTTKDCEIFGIADENGVSNSNDSRSRSNSFSTPNFEDSSSNILPLKSQRSEEANHKHPFKEIPTLNGHNASTLASTPQYIFSDIYNNTYCKICQKNFSHFWNLKRHCKQCHKMNNDEFRYFVSTYSAQPALSEQFPCSYHNKSSRLKCLPDIHLNNFSPNNPKMPKCDNCATFITDKGCECTQTEAVTTSSMDVDMQSTPQPPDIPLTGELTSKQLFTCLIGKMTFTNEKSMLLHYNSCNGKCENVFNCSDCRKGFRTQYLLDTHACTKTKKRYMYDCVQCLRSFSKRLYLIKHESKCSGVFGQASIYTAPPNVMEPNKAILKNLKPAIKEIPTTSQPDSKGAIAVPVAPAQQFYVCHVCTKVFNSPKAVSGHQRVHAAAKPQRTNVMFTCKFCSRGYITLKQLCNHAYKCVAKILMREKVISCKDCKEIFSREDLSKELASKVQNHIIQCYPIPYYRHEDEGEHSLKLLCSCCSYAFPTIESLTVHEFEHLKMKRLIASGGCSSRDSK